MSEHASIAGMAGVHTLDSDGCHRLICVFLMRHTQLVVSSDFRIRNLLPFRRTLEMLGFERWISEHFRVGRHCDEFIGRHSLPELVEEGAVVDAESGCNAFA